MAMVCDICGYTYDPDAGDPDNGIEAGTAWEDLPDDWVCPMCGAEKADFVDEWVNIKFFINFYFNFYEVLLW